MRSLYVSDLDGTLFNSRKEVTDYSAGLINTCIDQGMLFSIATARMPYGCDYRLEKIKLQIPCILTNGVFLYDFLEKKYLYTESIPKTAAENVIEAFAENREPCFMYLFSEGHISICYNDEELKAQEQYYSERALLNCKKIYYTDDFRRELNSGEVVYFALTGTKERLEPVTEALKKINGINDTCYLNIYNGLYCLEVFSGKASKKTLCSD